MYPKVKVRRELCEEEDDGFASDLGGLKSLDSLSLDDSISSSPVTVKTDISASPIVKEPKCFVPRVCTPRVPVTEDDGDCSFTSNSPECTGREKNDHISKNKLNTRASLIPRPRAVVSSPDNDILYRNRNRIRDVRPANRHVHCCKVKESDAADISPDKRKSKEPGSNTKTVPIEKKRVHKGSSIKSESVPRAWRF